MRVALPRDVRESQEILEKREGIIDQAMRDAKRVKAAAVTESRTRLDESELVKEAQRRAEEVVEEAQGRAQRLIDQAGAQADARRSGASEYAQEVLYGLEQEMASILTTVRRGIEVLEHDRESAVEQDA